MATIKQFEDLVAWRKARELTSQIYALTSGNEKLARDFGLKDQMRRAAVSVMANIAEGFERNGDGEFRQFLAIAKASCGELRSLLYVALDAGFIPPEDHKTLSDRCEEVSRIVSGLRSSLRTKPN